MSAKSAKPAAADDTPIIAAVDDGYAQIKVLTRTESGFTASITPTVVRSSMEGITDMGGTGDADLAGLGWYETDGARFTAGAKISGEETRFDGFHVSALNRVAIHHGLVAAGLGGKKVELVVGLPVADYYKGGAINEALISRKIANLSAAVTPLMSGVEPVTIVGVNIKAQAISSFVDHIVDENLLPRADVAINAPVGVVDVGGRTTDCAVVLDGRRIDQSRSGTENIGVIDAREALLRDIEREWPGASRLPAAALNRALREGILRIFGKEHDISEMAAAAKRPVEDAIFRAVSRHMDTVVDLDAVLVVGGGALAFPRLAQMFPNGIVVENPEFANVRGMLKYRLSRTKAVKPAQAAADAAA